jgi:putative peptidoglycan lipid II flippase
MSESDDPSLSAAFAIGPDTDSGPDTGPDSGTVPLAAPPEMLGPDALPHDPVVDTALGSGVTDEPRRASFGRAATLITVGNLVSRITGFVRVIAVAGALGIAYLGDSYQRANEVSNVLFELLAGGVLFSVLVPGFVELLTGATRGRRDRAGADAPDTTAARHLGSVLATRGSVYVGVVALIGMFGGTWIMQVLTIGTSEAVRADQVRIGAFLLWFIMPQLVFYAVGAVASALLQADHRFLATSIAPVFNNIVVTITMVVFAHGHDPAAGLTLTVGEKVLLGAGTLAGTVAMTIVPFVALWNAGLGLRPRWRTRGLSLGRLVRQGAWAAGHVGLNEVIVGATIILAGRVDGGVIAYQTAFMFFLLPHALIAYPIFTALFPRLSRLATRDDRSGFATELTRGMRLNLLLLIPASGLLAVAAAPALSVVRIGQLDAAGVRLVAATLAGFLTGLCAFSVYFLLTRASYALGDARSPTLVNLGSTVAAVVGMVVATGFVHGTALLVLFGLIQAVSLGAGCVVLFGIVRRHVGEPLPVGGALARSLVASVPAIGAAAWIASVIGWSSRSQAVVAGLAASAAGVAIAVALLALLRTPELGVVTDRLRRRAGAEP